MLDLKTLTAVLAVLTLTATATPATQGKTGVLCGKCYPDPNFIYGGSVMEFKSNPGKCGRFVPGFGWGPGKCRNEHCDLCMFFKYVASQMRCHISY